MNILARNGIAGSQERTCINLLNNFKLFSKMDKAIHGLTSDRWVLLAIPRLGIVRYLYFWKSGGYSTACICGFSLHFSDYNDIKPFFVYLLIIKVSFVKYWFSSSAYLSVHLLVLLIQSSLYILNSSHFFVDIFLEHFLLCSLYFHSCNISWLTEVLKFTVMFIIYFVCSLCFLHLV